MAAMILAFGVIGSFTLLDTANKTISTNNGRTGATNLARELAEYARGTDYDLLTPAQVETALRTRTRIAGTGATGSWEVVRRGVTYKIKPEVCTLDDPKDGLSATAPPNACTPGAAAIAGAPTEVNPDDFRRLTLELKWKDRQGGHKLEQAALIVNPSGGLGPRIKTFDEPAAQITAGTEVKWALGVNPVLTDPAYTLRWSVDDGASNGDLSGSATTSWSFTWSLGTLGTAPFVYDGTYLVSAQAFEARGIPGEARAVSVSVNRRVPYAPTSLVGGRNLRDGGVVDLDWARNKERDVIGYRVWRVAADGIGLTQICQDGGLDYTVKTSCTDTSLLAALAPSYQVAAVDYTNLKNGSGRRAGDVATVSIAPAGVRPDAPVLDNPTVVDGSAKLTWAAPSVGPGQRPIRLYRIYRDGGTSIADRYDVTVDTSTTWTDPAPGNTTSHKYWVTAVDTSNNESVPSNGVISP